MRKRIVLVVVASRTFHGQAQKCLAEGVGSIGHIRHPVLFIYYASFFGNFMISIKCRRQNMFFGGIGHEVARKLHTHKGIVRHIFVKCIYHPISPRPLAPVAIVLKAMRVCKPCYIHPIHRHFFAIFWASQQLVHFLLVVIFAIHLLYCGRKACKINGESFQKAFVICCRVGL